MVNPHVGKRRSVPAFDSLEQIQLLSTASLVRGIWTIRGTGGADTIVVSRDTKHPEMLLAENNGQTVGSVRASKVRQIRLNGLGGNDTLKIDESHGAVKIRATLNGGPGKNVLIGGSGPTVLDGGQTKTSLLQPGIGPTTLVRGLATDSVQRFGSLAAFRQFLSRSAAKLGGTGLRRSGPIAAITAPVADGNTPTPSAATGSHSTTNVQVPGVGEADIVETDGTNLYLISRGELVIVDASKPAAPSVTSRTALDGSPQGEYLDGSRLTVLSRVWQPDPASPAAGAKSDVAFVRPWIQGVSRVEVTTFDVSDPTHPRILQQTALDGSYSDSRMINGKLEIVLQSDLFYGYWGGDPVPLAVAGAGSSTTPTSLADAPVDRILPNFNATVFAADGTKTTRSGLITQPQDILAPTVGDDANLISVVVLDTRGTRPGPVGAESLLGSYESSIHVTSDRIYLFSPRWDDQGNATTSVYQFNLNGSDPKLAATGTVPGSLYNPYSADASGGYLRVATSSWQGNATDNGVYVLQQKGDRLNVVGMVDHIAPGESIYATRFEGDRVFMVTFKQVDPVWAIDLSKPASPAVVGKLTMPGFSTFLQPIDANTLLGIGRDADPDTGRTTDLKLALFDVHDLSHPSLIATQTIAPSALQWTWSNAAWDPHALGWFPELGAVAIPVEGYAPIPTGTDPLLPNWKSISNLYVYRINASAGSRAFQPLGTVDHTSAVMRSVRIGDVLYSIADEDVQSVQVVAGGLVPLGHVTIQTDTSGWPSGGGIGPLLL